MASNIAIGQCYKWSYHPIRMFRILSINNSEITYEYIGGESGYVTPIEYVKAYGIYCGKIMSTIYASR